MRTLHHAVTAYVGLGANLGDPVKTLQSAFVALADLSATRHVRASTLWWTEPIGGPPGQPRYVNAAVELLTELTPHRALSELLLLERRFGRDRSREVRWGPRTLDLDLLLWGEEIITEPELTVPHPRMHQRRFVLGPLAEIAANVRHPQLGRTIAELLADLPT